MTSTKPSTRLLWHKHAQSWPCLCVHRTCPLPPTSWLLPANSDFQVPFVITRCQLSKTLKYNTHVCLRHDKIIYLFWRHGFCSPKKFGNVGLTTVVQVYRETSQRLKYANRAYESLVRHKLIARKYSFGSHLFGPLIKKNFRKFQCRETKNKNRKNFKEGISTMTCCWEVKESKS